MNAIMKELVAAAKEHGGSIPFSDYANICLYGSGGYYRSCRKRIGSDGDFFTSVSLKHKVFGELVEAAAKSILKSEGADPNEFEFVEIGAEGDNLMIPETFALRYGDAISLPSNCILISNELLDARPFSRFEFKCGKWNEVYVNVEESNKQILLGECLCPASRNDEALIQKYFPRASVEGFKLEISRDAMALFEHICSLDWRGLLIFADYFRHAAEISELPSGTARTYSSHREGGDFTLSPGECDITYSPCSDIFEDIARKHAFANIGTLTHEAFFVKYSSEKIRDIISLPGAFAPRKRELCQLLSPAQMGAAFRVLFALRL